VNIRTATPPDEAYCDIHPREGVGWVGKEKVNARLSSPGLRRVRLELPGASSNPRGHQPAICLLSAAAFSPLPQAGSVDHADDKRQLQTTRSSFGVVVGLQTTTRQGGGCAHARALMSTRTL
jgi:hypothetical protein